MRRYPWIVLGIVTIGCTGSVDSTTGASSSGGSTGVETTDIETGSTGTTTGARSLHIDEGFGPLCLASSPQQGFNDQMRWKFIATIGAGVYPLPAGEQDVEADDTWPELGLSFSVTTHDGELAPPPLARYGYFPQGGGQVWYPSLISDHDLLRIHQPLWVPGPGEEHVELRIRVAAAPGDDFVLDSSTPEARSARTMNLVAYSPEGGAGLANVDVENCDIEGTVRAMHIEFDRGSLDVDLRYFPAQSNLSGFAVEASGTLDGESFAQENMLELAYYQQDFGLDVTSVLVRFGEPIGDACGLAFLHMFDGLGESEPDPAWPPSATTISCDLEGLEELVVSSVSVL